MAFPETFSSGRAFSWTEERETATSAIELGFVFLRWFLVFCSSFLPSMKCFLHNFQVLEFPFYIGKILNWRLDCYEAEGVVAGDFSLFLVLESLDFVNREFVSPRLTL